MGIIKCIRVSLGTVCSSYIDLLPKRAVTKRDINGLKSDTGKQEIILSHGSRTEWLFSTESAHSVKEVKHSAIEAATMENCKLLLRRKGASTSGNKDIVWQDIVSENTILWRGARTRQVTGGLWRSGGIPRG